ncbi:MAG: M16 family metallopeptidase [Parabacteroides sp.]
MKLLLPLRVQEYKLSNGLTVWLNEDHSQPKVFGAVVVKAGAKDCPDTGIAHYFEHMMFKGTDRIGTIDYPAEKRLLDQIEVKYDELAVTEDAARRKQLLQEINALNVQAAEYVIPNEFDRLISRYGGTKLNAGTSYDFTVYYNTFAPQYMAHWAELNSERLRNPVFRLFQNELETVYEEKNMYSDYVATQAMEKMTERYFYPHPYAFPVIGSTKNLKNPRLSEMRKFFETYYVASNMGLILSGDFRSEQTLPILERTFTRIRQGEVPAVQQVDIPTFHGKEKMTIKVPIPFMKVMAMGFRGVSANHEDQIALKVAVSLLNNSNGTGFLDKLTVEHKVVGSMAMNESMNEAGILGILVMPKFLLQSYSAAEKMIWKQIDRVKQGDFSEEDFQSLKLELKREYASGLEDISARAQMMMRIFSQGKQWGDYLKEVARIDALEKADVVRIANKYFTDDYLFVTKQTGRYPKDNLPKPDFTPIVPKNKNASSAYVKQLEQLPVEPVQPRFIHFQEDVEKTDLYPWVHLYRTLNEINDIFSLRISFGLGQLERPMLPHVATYLHFVGTEKQTFDQFRKRLQVLGSTMSFQVTDTDFTVEVTGFDRQLADTLPLIGEFLCQANAEQKKMRQVIEDAKVTEKAFLKSSESLSKALLERVKYGADSRYLRKWSLSELQKQKADSMIGYFQELQEVECNVHYCGTLPMERVSQLLKDLLPLDRVCRPSHSSLYRSLTAFTEPQVFLYDMPHVSQSIVYSFTRGGVQPERRTSHLADVFTGYFGGDMSSLMFQEIREFRSFAYRVNARYRQPTVRHRFSPGCFDTMLATQSDKTVDALSVLDGLLKEMPVYPERIGMVKQRIVNRINNDYPTFRKISTLVARLSREGYTEDPNRLLLESLPAISMEDVLGFYAQQVQHRPIAYAIVGNLKKMDLKRLETFGKVTRMKKSDIYK